MKEPWLDRAENRFGRHCIRNLMAIIVMGMGIVFIVDFAFRSQLDFSLSSWLAFDRDAVMHGQIWRLITFVFIPPDSSLLFILFSLYFYWMIGTGLENQWGSFKFDMFYLCGVICTVISGMITGYATNSYLNLSLFLAFALIYPDFQVWILGLIPIKVKYLAIIDAAGLMISLFTVHWRAKIALLAAVGNVLLFAGGYFAEELKRAKRRREWRNNFRN